MACVDVEVGIPEHSFLLQLRPQMILSQPLALNLAVLLQPPLQELEALSPMLLSKVYL